MNHIACHSHEDYARTLETNQQTSTISNKLTTNTKDLSRTTQRHQTRLILDPKLLTSTHVKTLEWYRVMPQDT